MRNPAAFQPGDRVRLTADFLRSTGQLTGSEPFSRWTVLAVQHFGSDQVPDLVVTNELRDDPSYWFTPEELAADPYRRYRRILAVNLERCR